MAKETFEVKMMFGENCYLLDVKLRNEIFRLSFESDDEWQTIKISDGTVYDVHLLKEDKFEVAIYYVTVTQEIDTGTVTILDYLDTDCSEDGQQIVKLEDGDIGSQ